MQDIIIRKAVRMFQHIQIAGRDHTAVFFRCKTVILTALHTVVDAVTSGLSDQKLCQQGIALRDHVQCIHYGIPLLSDKGHHLPVGDPDRFCTKPKR